MFRLWAASTEFRNDIPYSQTILNGLSDWYRKFRNTCRFLLGNLFDFSPDRDSVARADMLPLDRYAMQRLDDLITRVRAAYAAYEFHVVYRALVDYVAVELSALYLDVAKSLRPAWRSTAAGRAPGSETRARPAPWPRNQATRTESTAP
jgi:isoleucyl-tRNA synthetase